MAEHNLGNFLLCLKQASKNGNYRFCPGGMIFCLLQIIAIYSNFLIFGMCHLHCWPTLGEPSTNALVLKIRGSNRSTSQLRSSSALCRIRVVTFAHPARQSAPVCFFPIHRHGSQAFRQPAKSMNPKHYLDPRSLTFQLGAKN